MNDYTCKLKSATAQSEVSYYLCTNFSRWYDCFWLQCRSTAGLACYDRGCIKAKEHLTHLGSVICMCNHLSGGSSSTALKTFCSGSTDSIMMSEIHWGLVCYF